MIFQALQPEIIQNKVGKFIPFIFIEWVHLPEEKKNCPSYLDWVEIFFESGYSSLHPGDMRQIDWDEFFLEILWVHNSVIHP